MMLKKLISITVLTSIFIASGLQAAQKSDEVITKKLSQYDIVVEDIQPSPVSGIFEVQTDNGILYTNHDASHFFFGKLYETRDKEIIDLTAKTQAKRNLALLKKAKVENEVIVYPAKQEKYAINIFTDTTCGYCVKLHSEMKKYNELGITVRYLAFPRGGYQANNIGQMSAIWCAENKNKAMDLAKSGSFKENNSLCLNMVRRHYDLGLQMGVNGTPAILLDDGSMVGGYLPAAKLLERLEQQSL